MGTHLKGLIMASKGIKTRYGTGDVLQRLMDNPITQQEIVNQSNVGQDKRAISGLSRTLGKSVASEQMRMMALDDIGDRLSRRKDRLAFSKKVLKSQKDRWEQSNKLAKAQTDYKDSMFGIEFGIGMGATATEIYGSHEQRKRDDEYLKGLSDYRDSLKTRDEEYIKELRLYNQRWKNIS